MTVENPDPTIVPGESSVLYENVEVPDPAKEGTTQSVQPNEGFVQGQQGE